jgi:uncharacterized beta-barrel protein YwiB (DUF1934 family)
MIGSYEMNENVRILIDGIVDGENESRITTNAIGHYQKLDEVHILKYPESAAEKSTPLENKDTDYTGIDKDCINTIKFSPGLVEMSKIGDNSTHMVFDLSCSTQSVYDTPYGSLYFQIQTTMIDIKEKENEIILHMEYSLSHNDSHISDNTVDVFINKTDK